MIYQCYTYKGNNSYKVVVKTKINNLPPHIFTYVSRVSEGDGSPPY